MMNTETAASPDGEANTPATEIAETVTEATAPAGGETETTETETTGPDISDLLDPEDEFVEVEIDGKKGKVAAALKDGYLRQADYTVKTQTLAEERRALAAQQAQVQQVQQMSAAEVTAIAEIHNLNSQLAPYINAGVDWDLISDDDPELGDHKVEARRLANALQTKQARLNEHLTLKHANAEREAANARQLEDARAAKEIKDWSPEKRQTLEQFAVTQGIPAEFAKDAGAAEFKILDKAHRWEQFVERNRANAQKAAADSKTAPAGELGQGSGSGTSDPTQMTMTQYKAWRARQDA